MCSGRVATSGAPRTALSLASTAYVLRSGGALSYAALLHCNRCDKPSIHCSYALFTSTHHGVFIRERMIMPLQCSPPGQFATLLNGAFKCEPCKPGYYRSGDASPENNVCVPIPAGKSGCEMPLPLDCLHSMMRVQQTHNCVFVSRFFLPCQPNRIPRKGRDWHSRAFRDFAMFVGHILILGRGSHRCGWYQHRCPHAS